MLKLPSQHTLRDCMHLCKCKCGFSKIVDDMLVEAAEVKSCLERIKYALLLRDRMHVRKDLVYFKRTGELISFTNLGDINDHL